MEKRKPLPPTYFFFSMLALIALHFLLPITGVLEVPWNLTGLIPVIIGAILNLLADNDFKKHNTTVKPFEKSSVLITKGVFNITRNPMYLGMALLLIGAAMILGSLSPYICVIVFILLMNVVFIKAEEKQLADVFGDEWEKYKQSVRRWI